MGCTGSKAQPVDTADVQVQEVAPTKTSEGGAAATDAAAMDAAATDAAKIPAANDGDPKSQKQVLDNANIVGPYSLRVPKKDANAPAAADQQPSPRQLTPRDRAPTLPDMADEYSPQPATTRFAGAVADDSDSFAASPPINTRFVGARADSTDANEPGTASPRGDSAREQSAKEATATQGGAAPPIPAAEPSDEPGSAAPIELPLPATEEDEPTATPSKKVPPA